MINKKIALGVVALGLSAAAISANAATSGVYVGGQLGYGNVHQADHVSGVKDNHLAGRVFAGYQFNQNLAAELGWSHFSEVTAKDHGYYADYDYSARLNTNVVDAAAKGIVPVADNVSLYGKLGAAYVMESVHAHYGPFSASASEKKLLPEAGVGVSYAFTDNVSADVSYTRIQKVGDKNKSDINSIDFAGVGVSYTFG